VDIDRNAPATAAGEIQIAASPEAVWAVLSDLSNWPAWNADVRSMAFDGPLAPGTEFRWKSGSASMASVLQVVDTPNEIAWTGTSMGIHAVHVFRFQPKDGGTLARSEESFSGLIPSVLRSYSRKILQRGIDNILGALKAEAERRGTSRIP
jgi:uncharacterized protein YndB with AHSA1/START domain